MKICYNKTQTEILVQGVATQSKGEMSVEIKIHPDAKENFNQKANELLVELKQFVSRTPKIERQFNHELYVSAKFTENDIIDMKKEALIDPIGNVIGKSFFYEGREIGLFGTSYKKLQNLAQSMQRTKPLKQFICMGFLLDVIFEWMEARYKNTSASNMVEFVLHKCKNAIVDIEIWIPIAYLCIENDIKIGKITFKTFKKAMFEQWIKTKPNLKEAFIKEQKEHQGTAAATIKLYAEPERAFEIAVEETEKSLSILRLFHPANLHPELHSYCQIYGKENLERMKFFHFSNEATLPIIDEQIIDKNVAPFLIDNKHLTFMKSRSLDVLSHLLEDEKLSDFQKKVLEAMLLYSKSSISKDFYDRLLYVLIALETILLRNDNEPIQQNVGERMAFFVTKNPEHRKLIIKNLKDIYAIRSSFLHHGQTCEGFDKLGQFLKTAFAFFNKLIFSLKKFETHSDFINSIEDIKLS